jgi:hypothetical protein
MLNGTVYATTVDSAGNTYVTGLAGSSLPTTPGAFEATGSGAFVAKLSPTGSLLYATYLTSTFDNGCSGLGGGIGIAVDSAGDAYVLGELGAVSTTANALASGGSTFVAELNPIGHIGDD